MASDNHTASALSELDPDRYAASLVIPQRHRWAVQAVWAFSAEIAAIRERVSEPGPGEIRLQWWADALEGEGHGAVRSNPVADSLFSAIARYNLPTGPLIRLLAARRFDLYGDPMSDIGHFEGYAGETVSVLYQYAAMILAGGRIDDAADAAGHLGVAEALAGHLRAFGFNAARGQLFLPLSVFVAHGVREPDIYAGRESPGLDTALAQLHEMALGHLAKARDAMTAVPRDVRPAFASMATVGAALGMKPQAGQAFAGQPGPSPLARLARLVWWSLRNG